MSSADGAWPVVWVQPLAHACSDATAFGIPTAVLDVSPCKVS